MDDGISNTSNIKSLKFPMIIKLCLGCKFKSNFFDWCCVCKVKHFKLSYNKFPSGNDEIDNLLKGYYCESGSSKGFIEWIPYDEFKDIIHTTINKETYSALLLKGSICGWDKDKFNWSRKIKKVTLVNCEHDIDFYRILKEKEKYKPYGISKDLTSHSYILVFDDEGYNQNLCIKCQILSSFFDWCKSCKLNHFQLNYGESPSGNDEIDKILKGYYCESARFIEWISYEEFKDITHNVVNKETYSALWLKGCIYDWNKDEFNWNRKIIKVVLAKSKCIISDLYGVLKKEEKYKLYGISKDPSSHSYILSCKLNHFKSNYGEFPSGNDEIDKFLKDNYCEVKSLKELIEWIPYDEFKNIRNITHINEVSLKYYSAIWNTSNNPPNWDRKNKNLKVILINSEDLGHIYKILKVGKYMYQPYGITKNPVSLNYLLIFEYSTDFLKLLNKPKDYQIIDISKDEKHKDNLITYYLKNISHFSYSYCKFKISFFNWCKSCKLNHFRFNYGEFPSGNDEIDNILKDNYCESNKISELIEWIPYNLFIDISYINQGGFSKVYSALWLNNNIYEWDHIESLEWKRHSGYRKVVLKVLESSCYNISGFLQEVQSYYKIGFSHKITKLYGISKEPNTQNYVLVLEYVNHGSLRSFLDKYNKYLITTYKIQILKNIAEGIKEIHLKSITHQDIHSDNILTKDFDRVKITDLGLSKFVSRDEKKENVYKVYGNLPYIAPEVLRGKQYTQKADIYAFGIIINEVFTGERPFHNVISNNLMLDICEDGLRPETRENTPKCLVHLLNKCWDATPLNRPTVDEIIQKLNHFETEDIIFEELRNYNNEVIKQYFESNSKSDHLKTSNSSKLHSTNPSNFTELLDCCISNENEEPGSASTSRNNYQVANSSNELVINNNSECYDCVIESNLLSGN
ncbi:kinase-like protein [Rhizophagus irregularis]|uniref:Kinase-like protein n=1 Tax=Rhizophagus irregularis TaxID=588596 RepID=A0A2I1GRH2_9GLOM|nr:kinase-like protein [Rhizophagus irregularis]